MASQGISLLKQPFYPVRSLAALLISLLAFSGLSLASPSAFPENAAFAGLGYRFGVGLGGEVVLPVQLLDMSLGLELYLPFADPAQTDLRLSGSALVFPAFGTSPPLALGLGADVGYGARGFNFHLGPTVGADFLFFSELPMIASLYLAPGYAAATGFSLAWSGQLRYYFDDLALELSSSDLAALALSVRALF